MDTAVPEPLQFLVTDQVPPAFVRGLEGLGFLVTHIARLSNQQLADRIGAYAGLVVNTSLLIDKSLIDKAVKLKYLLRPGSGLDNIDVTYARQKNILVINSPEANSDAVAEHAIGMLLGLANHIPKADNEIKHGQWIRMPNTGWLLKGKTIGIIGYGNTGAAMAQKISGFGMRILVYDKYKSGFGTGTVIETSPEVIYNEADILSLHIPLTPETSHLINSEYIGRFKKPFFLINTSRGKIVDLAALVGGLKTGKLRGVALDVLENESFETYSPIENQIFAALISADNVLLTPHIAGWTLESREAIFMLLLEKFKNYFQDKT